MRLPLLITVRQAAERHGLAGPDGRFHLQDLVGSDLTWIREQSGSPARDLAASIRLCLQRLRDRGWLAFEEPGTYRWLGGHRVGTAP